MFSNTTKGIIEDMKNEAKYQYKKAEESARAFKEENPELVLFGTCFARGFCIGGAAGLVARAVPPLAPVVVPASLVLSAYDGWKQGEKFIAEQEAKQRGLHVV